MVKSLRRRLNKMSAAPTPTGGRECQLAVLAVFPDICPDYLKTICSANSEDAGTVINLVMDELEQNNPYPKKSNASLKRKREGSPEDEKSEANHNMTELKRMFDNPARRAEAQSTAEMLNVCNILLLQFKFVPLAIIQETMRENDNLLLASYLALELVLRNWASYSIKPWPTLTSTEAETSTRLLSEFARSTDSLKASIGDLADSNPILFTELVAATQVRDERIKVAVQQEERVDAEKRRDAEALAEGFIGECGCCYDDFPIHRMIHCDAQSEHMFCVGCARLNAESQVGLSRHELTCMSTDACSGGFSFSERAKFLDEKLTAALSRIEAESVVLLSGLDVVKCPFCPFAAECDPIELNRELDCKNPSCMKVSCRLCGKESHVPKTCDEANQDRHRSARIQIEEAMSNALIRLCNKCKTAFIKTEGCNKMRCTKAGCGNTQCYICSKTCDYEHFRNPRDPKSRPEGCPLYDDVESRHSEDVKKAQAAITETVRSEQPDIDPKHLEINVSEKVRQDEERRLKRDQDPQRIQNVRVRGHNMRNPHDRIHLHGRGNPEFDRPPPPPDQRAHPFPLPPDLVVPGQVAQQLPPQPLPGNQRVLRRPTVARWHQAAAERLNVFRPRGPQPPPPGVVPGPAPAQGFPQNVVPPPHWAFPQFGPPAWAENFPDGNGLFLPVLPPAPPQIRQRQQQAPNNGLDPLTQPGAQPSSQGQRTPTEPLRRQPAREAKQRPPWHRR